jgi:hypothetical protein
MANVRRTYSPQEFLDRLERDDLALAVPMTGVAGKAGDRDHVMFGDDCASWTALPVSVIDSIEHLDFIRCGTHMHPLVRIQLRELESDDTRAFARMAVYSRRRRRDDNDIPKVLPAFTDRGPVVVPIGSGHGGGGYVSAYGSSAGPGGDTYYGVWCPQEGCFVGSIWLYSSQAAQDASAHNASTGHRAGVATL